MADWVSTLKMSVSGLSGLGTLDRVKADLEAVKGITKAEWVG
jgi:hypothetical protein